MSLVKSCSVCGRIYDDLSYHFCLEDGGLLSDEYEVQDEVETLVGNKRLNFDALLRTREFGAHIARIVEGFRRTKNTKDFHEVRNTAPVFERAESDFTSSEHVRRITFEISGWQTFHAQHNLEILRDYVNEQLPTTNPFAESKLQLGTGNFYTKDRIHKFSFDFKAAAHPTSASFLKKLTEFGEL